MTIAQAIAATDALQPNAYTQTEKITWLAQLDGQVMEDVFRTHTDGPSTYLAYTEQTPTDTPLLIAAPYDQIYPIYLGMQMDRCNGELTRYNNAAQLFNNCYLTFQAYWNRTHSAAQNLSLHL